MFIDQNSVIDREALRTYTLKELNQIRELVLQKFEPKNQSFWNKVHDAIVTTGLSDEDKKKYLHLEEQIQHLPDYIQRWINTAVDTQERIEFFIASKADEIKSGDAPRDYFWALQVRHDQLVALVRVLSNLNKELDRWLTLEPQLVLDDPIFQGLLEYDVEKQIYLEAENIHKSRTEIMK